MSASGTTTVDFGAYPGSSDATAAVTGQAAITGTSVVGAWLLPAATADHTADEHRVEELVIGADTPVAGTGFTIYGTAGNFPLYGTWSVAWAWV
jgi:hypothetical protein